VGKAKKIAKIEEWLVKQQEAAVITHDYTREMALRDVLRKVWEVQNG
jgi:nickel-dependent lactate racemase